jgi:hypothetical protein
MKKKLNDPTEPLVEKTDVIKEDAQCCCSEKSDENKEKELVEFWIDKNPDFHWFTQKIGWPNPTCGQVEKAVLSCHTIEEMDRFYTSFLLWYTLGENDGLVADFKARADIGFAMNKGSFMQRLKWRLKFGIKKSNYHYA